MPFYETSCQINHSFLFTLCFYIPDTYKVFRKTFKTFVTRSIFFFDLFLDDEQTRQYRSTGMGTDSSFL